MTVAPPIAGAIVPPIQSPILSGRSGLTLPYQTGLLLNLIPDESHTSRDENALVMSVSGSGPSTSTQTQGNAANRFAWVASSAIGARATLSKTVTTPYLLTPGGAALSQPFVVYVVVSPPIGTPTIIIFDGSSIGSRAVLAYIGTNTWQMLGASGTISLIGYSLPAKGALFTCVFDGASSELRVNGSSVGTGTTSTAALDLFTVGARFSLSNAWAGNQSAFIVQTGHPSASQLAQNESAITRFFGL